MSIGGNRATALTIATPPLLPALAFSRKGRKAYMAFHAAASGRGRTGSTTRIVLVLADLIRPRPTQTARFGRCAGHS